VAARGRRVAAWARDQRKQRIGYAADILSQNYIIVKVVEIHDWEIIQEDAIIQRYKSLALHLPWPPALASYHPNETCLIV